MTDPHIRPNLNADTTDARLRFMAASITDPHMSRILREAAAAWRAGYRSSLLLAVVAFADDLASEARKEMRHGR